MKTKGSLYLRNRDADGKKLLVFDVKKHTKGVNNMADMQRMFLYFLERVDREDPDGMVTIGNEWGKILSTLEKIIFLISLQSLIVLVAVLEIWIWISSDIW